MVGRKRWAVALIFVERGMAVEVVPGVGDELRGTLRKVMEIAWRKGRRQERRVDGWIGR